MAKFEPADAPRQWTEQQLDAALAGLHRVDEPSERAMAVARQTLMAHAATPGFTEGPVGEMTPDVGVASTERSAAAGESDVPAHLLRSRTPRSRAARRTWRRQAVLATAVAAAAAAALVLPSLHWGSSRPSASAAAAEMLNRAADAATDIGARDAALKPGQYRYSETNAWYMSESVDTTGSQHFAVLTHTKSQRWTPADWHDTWMERRTDTGEHKWILGTEAEAKAAGMDLASGPPPTHSEMKGPCQNYFEDLCTGEGNWQGPSLRWLAALPRDPDKLYAKLVDDTRGRGHSVNGEMLVYVTDALRGGLLPADVRAAMYRVLAKVPGIEITDSAVNLDGQIGVAFAIDDGSWRSETIIDPATGVFIGERNILREASDGIPAGTVVSYTAVYTAVVDKIGQLPKG
jgi:hypothetical protein